MIVSLAEVFILGFQIILLGLIVFIALRAIVLWVARRRALTTKVRQKKTPPQEPVSPLLGIIALASDGQVAYMNSHAAQWLGGQEKPTHLEQLARSVQPSERLLRLADAENRVRFWVRNLTLDAESHRLPAEWDWKTLILIQPQTTTVKKTGSPEVREDLLQIVANFIHDTSGGMGIDQAVRSILDRIRQIFEADWVELTLYDPARDSLSPYSTGNLYLDDFHRQGQDEDVPPDRGFAKWLIQNQRPLFIPDVEERAESAPKIDKAHLPFRAYLGTPLISGGELQGTIELARLQPNTFDLRDLTFLEALGAYAAGVLFKARHAAARETQSGELESLTEFIHSIPLPADAEQRLRCLAQGIAQLMDVNIFGFLHYDEPQQRLVGQPPFVGLSSHFVSQHYNLPASPEDPIYKAWFGQRHWLSNQVESDPEIDALSLRALAEEASLHTLLIVPFSYGEQRQGLLQAANKSHRRPFNRNDIRILTILATQCAAFLENEVLARDLNQQTTRIKSLQQIIQATSSDKSMDEVLALVMRETCRSLPADIGVILLLDHESETLQPHNPSFISPAPENMATTLTFQGADVEESVTKRISATLSNQGATDPSLPAPYVVFSERFHVKQIMIAAIAYRDQPLGEILLARSDGEDFTETDLEQLNIVACQLALFFARTSSASPVP